MKREDFESQKPKKEDAKQEANKSRKRERKNEQKEKERVKSGGGNHIYKGHRESDTLIVERRPKQ